MNAVLSDFWGYAFLQLCDYPGTRFRSVIYRIRPIDFDQQTYEGNLKVYLPQYFKENNVMVNMVLEKLKPNSIEQYRKEVRSQIVKESPVAKTDSMS